MNEYFRFNLASLVKNPSSCSYFFRKGVTKTQNLFFAKLELFLQCGMFIFSPFVTIFAIRNIFEHIRPEKPLLFGHVAT